MSLPFSVEASEFIAGYLISVDFNEEVLEPKGVDYAYVRPDGEKYEFGYIDINDDNDNPGSGGVDEGLQSSESPSRPTSLRATSTCILPTASFFLTGASTELQTRQKEKKRRTISSPGVISWR